MILENNFTSNSFFWRKGGWFAICPESVNQFGIHPAEDVLTRVKMTISTVRPHSKGWKTVRLIYSPTTKCGKKVKIGKTLFTTLPEHRDLFEKYNTSVGYVKMEVIQ
jgi:hypothetical protein